MRLSDLRIKEAGLFAALGKTVAAPGRMLGGKIQARGVKNLTRAMSSGKLDSSGMGVAKKMLRDVKSIPGRKGANIIGHTTVGVGALGTGLAGNAMMKKEAGVQADFYRIMKPSVRSILNARNAKDYIKGIELGDATRKALEALPVKPIKKTTKLVENIAGSLAGSFFKKSKNLIGVEETLLRNPKTYKRIADAAL